MTGVKEMLQINQDKSRLSIVAMLIAAVMGLFAAGCVGTKAKPGEEVELTKSTLSVSQMQQPFDLFSEYHIQPGDILDVLFQVQNWVEQNEFRIDVDYILSVKFPNTPELNEEQSVRPDGTISLPYIGSILAKGKTLDELTTELSNKYSKILQEPEIYITVHQFRIAIDELKKDLHTSQRGSSRLVTVRPDGYATFPMVGDLPVANRPIPEVNKELNKRYETVVAGLHCDLFLEKSVGTQIYVLGQVAKPGAYPILRPISVVEAIGLAGSELHGARLDSVIVARRSGDKVLATRVDVAAALSLAEKGNYFYLEADDIVYVPKTWIARAAEVVRDLRDISFFQGWSVGFNWILDDRPLLNRSGVPTSTTTINP